MNMDIDADALFSLLHSHRSVRSYEPEPIDSDTIRRIVDAGRRASTSSNLQMTTAVVVRDEDRREELARLCGDQDHIREAPVFIAWCADRSRLDRVCAARGYEQNTEYLESFLVAAMDVAITMQNATVAAEALGLGVCHIGGLRNDTAAVIELLDLPRRVFPIAGMTIGRPRGAGHTKPRLDLDAILHWERYDPEDRDLLAAYDRTMAETGIYRGREVPGKDGTPYGWMEHTARRLRNPKRTDLTEVLARQGFLLR